MADVTRLKNRARREEQRENWSRAIELYTQALSEGQARGDSVADLSLYNRIGDIYLRIGQKNTAIRYYEEAIERYGEQELHASAIALCNKVLRIHPARSLVFLQLGRLHLATNLIADASSHYHRYAEAMWELGKEDAALEGIEELIRETGDARSVEVWSRWLILATDRVAAGERVESLRESLSAYDFDVDDLLARIDSAEVPAADRAAARDTSVEPDEPAGAAVLGETEIDEDAPALPLLGEPTVETATPSIDPRLESEPDLAPELSPQTSPEPGLEIDLEEHATLPDLPELAEPVSIDLESADLEFADASLADGELADTVTTSEESWTVPWESEGDEAELAGWDPDVSEVASADDWGPALELGERSIPLVGGDMSTLPPLLDAIEPGSRDPLTLEPEVGTGHEGSESAVLSRAVGEEGLRPAAWYDASEDGVGSDPPPPSLGGYASESPEHLASGPGGLEEAPGQRHDGVEALISIGHSSPADRPSAERVEPPTAWRNAATGTTREVDLDELEGQEVGLVGHQPTPFEAEVDERSAGDDFRLEELVDRAERMATDEPGQDSHLPAGDAALLEREDSIENAGLPGRMVDDSTGGSPPSLDAEPVETDRVDAPDLAEWRAPGTAHERSETSGSPPAALEKDEPAGSRPDASEEGQPIEADLDAPERDLASLGPDDAAEPPLPAVSDTEFLESLDALRDAQARREEASEDASEAVLPVEEVEPPPVGDTEEESRAWAEDTQVELAAADDLETVESRRERLDSDDASIELELGPGTEPEPPSQRRPADLAASQVSMERVIEAAPKLERERDDAFREWVKSAPSQVLRRALTELEMRAELDKGLMVVERLLAVQPDEPDLFRKRLEYASSLQDDAVVVETHIDLGQCLERCGRPLEARKAYESLLALDPDHAVAKEAVQRLQDVTDGQVEQEEGAPLGRPTESMRGPVAIGGLSGTSGYGDLTAGGTAAEDRPMPYSGVAGGGEAAADFEQLLSEFRAELHDHPQQSDSMTRTELGASLKEMGRLDDAIRELQAAVREPQAPAMAYELLGEAFLDKGQARVAMRLLRQALEGSSWEDRETLGVLYQLGVAYQELGEPANALGCYERIFSVDIDYRDVQQRILSCS